MGVVLVGQSFWSISLQQIGLDLLPLQIQKTHSISTGEITPPPANLLVQRLSSGHWWALGISSCISLYIIHMQCYAYFILISTLCRISSPLIPWLLVKPSPFVAPGTSGM